MANEASSNQLVICDAGPIIHLDEVNCLFLLNDFTRVLIPDAVWNEVKYHSKHLKLANK
jgi:hypothetical protein